jgi:hypothetical protein
MPGVCRSIAAEALRTMLETISAAGWTASIELHDWLE